MINISATVKKNFTFAAIAKQTIFATAVALTATAKDAQNAVIDELPKTFTIRGGWSQPSNKFGIKVKTAKKSDLTAVVGTMADWLELHESGGTKTPRGANIAIPTTNVRRNKKEIIVRSNRPRNLPKAFILTTKAGNKVIFTRKGRGKKKTLVALYNLEPRANIRKQSTFYEPIQKAVDKNLHKNFEQALIKALKTAK
jgi:hypothetical protein